MTSDESDAISRYNLDDDDDSNDDLPERRYWWSLHRPETYALTAAVIALSSISAAATDLYQAILFALSTEFGGKTSQLTVSATRLGMALLGVLAAAVSIRDEDEDSTWSPPVARAALLVTSLAAVLSLTAIIITAATSTGPSNNFGGP
jgi:peptidoglycan/LPS O-acetylase OafA/YrhL